MPVETPAPPIPPVPDWLRPDPPASQPGRDKPGDRVSNGYQTRLRKGGKKGTPPDVGSGGQPAGR